MTRWLLRAARPEDVDALAALAQARAIGISSLATERAALAEQIAQSQAAFTSDDDASGEERYLFVLQELRSGRLAGTAGIAAAAGFNDRFYSYRNEFIVQTAPALGARNRIHTLHLCHDLTGVTLLTGFHIDAALADTPAPQLLSRGRLAFIAAQAERFSDRIAAENPGLADESGRCPFWDAVGQRFFGMGYPEAERLTGGFSPKGWIAELMPQGPIYVPLLPEEAQWSLGQLHPVGDLPFSMLLDEGLDGDTYLNLFDGGPTAEGRVATLKTVRRRRAVAAEAAPAGRGPGAAASAAPPAWWLVDNGRRDGFAAMLLPAPAPGQALALDAGAISALGWAPGHRLWAAPLDAPAMPHANPPQPGADPWE
ncbi:arginine N-succinyltransferase [Aquabacterium sp. OR-4]|uniref:arginine N-succinyltransferase n=1 Tax=Aquabacterium sp. OR-4 TaxID=2978127 RepID=UPI0021B4C411|nr:arginine N-succinyltransferase [Aquabacterium sp. OR-4]MDT7833725.1 arginine N-succinyltransferase [Aquabacterium sp. OR-4]